MLALQDDQIIPGILHETSYFKEPNKKLTIVTGVSLVVEDTLV
jgi:hypothetical protein